MKAERFERDFLYRSCVLGGINSGMIFFTNRISAAGMHSARTTRQPNEYTLLAEVLNLKDTKLYINETEKMYKVYKKYKNLNMKI